MADLKEFVFLFCLLSQCAPSLQAESMIFVADYSSHTIFMADFSSGSLDSLTFDALPISSFYPFGVDYDPDTRMVYWTEVTGLIRRANIDGTMQSVIAANAQTPFDLALDTSRGKVFWTDLNLDRISSANLDGSSQQILINTNITRPQGIIIHKGEGLMFWTDYSRIERANLDGGDRYVIVNSGIAYPSGLAFNADSSRVYWCEAGIESVDLWGNDRMVHLATSSISPWDLAVIDDSIIWTDMDDGMGVTSTNSSNGYRFYHDNTFDDPRGLHVYRAVPMIFVADYSSHTIFMADFSSDSLDSLTFDALPISSFYPFGVDYDPVTRMVYWTEVSSGRIRRANIDGTMQSVIAENAATPLDLALDTSRGKVFWTDVSLSRISSANLDGSSQQILINTDIISPHGIIIHKGEGVMFWTDENTPSRIERANLDGGDRYVIVNSGIIYANGLAFNADSSRVYWCDAGIESVDLWGNDRMVHLATSSISPWDLAVIDDSIIWTDLHHDGMGVTSTNSSNGYRFYHDNTFDNPRGLHVYRE